MSRKKSLIVLIDDEVDLCVVLAAMLRSQGFDVIYFHTLAEGVAGIKSSQPDWVIIDNNLPDGLGWEQTDAILAAVPQVNIIKISANPDSVRQPVRDGVHYLIKPINVNSVVRLINAPVL